MATDDIGLRYGSASAPRVDSPATLEQPPPLRTLPVRAITPFTGVFPAPLSIGGDTGCAIAALRVQGSTHISNALGVGLCPPNATSGNAWINNQLVVGADPGGSST